jgi:hypothetical protein
MDGVVEIGVKWLPSEGVTVSVCLAVTEIQVARIKFNITKAMCSFDMLKIGIRSGEMIYAQSG